MDLHSMRLLTLASLLLWAAAATSVAEEQESTNILSCAEEFDDQKRLSCYDREIARLMRDGTTIPVIAPRVGRAKLEDDFGMRGVVLRKANEKKQRENPRIEKLEAKVVKISTSPNGRLLFDIENGQQWEQTHGNAAIFVKEGDEVFFTRGTLGSFWLTTEQRRAVRVRRLR
jgi:hypothetical protein